METNVNYTIVGAFVISLTALIIFFIIWLSAGISWQKYTTYKVYMKEAVSGLSIDAPVEYNGVNVGQVKSIKINNKNPQLVELLLNIKKDAPITEGTRAKLDLRSIAGVTFISLEDKGKNMTPLKVQPGQTYPVISTTPSILVRLDTALTQINASFSRISISIQSLLDKQNLNSIKQILVNLHKASAQFEPLLKSSEGSMSIIQKETLPGANQTISHLNEITNDLSDVTTEIKANPSVLIRGKKEQPLGPGEN